jgi:2'-hydroxyisoflavone reductase
VRILVLGGTRFVGRHVVEAALAAGHEPTLFHRGTTGADLFPTVERVHGDRDGGLAGLENRDWDSVIDVSGYVPRLVRASARLLAGRTGHATFVSSVSVLADEATPGQDESAPVRTVDDPTTEDVEAHYGALKALCEAEVEAAFPGRALIVRPGLVAGPHDPTDRFTYWVRRVAEGGEVLAPDAPDVQTQLINARDLGAWIVRMVEGRAIGTYVATGPAVPVAFGELLGSCRTASGSDATFTWVPQDFLLDAGVRPWSEIPLWLPTPDNGLLSMDVRKAVSAGLTFRPLGETVRDVLTWDAGRPRDRSLEAGLPREREAALLSAWARGSLEG